jgi:MFS family permease
VVFRPSLSPSAHRREVGRNLALDLVGAVGMGVSLALVVALLPTIARRGGLEPIGLAALAAAPFIANLLGAFAGRYGPRSTRQLALVRAAGASSLLVLFILPTPPVMIAAGVVFWISLSFSSPFQLRMWGVMYPARLRGRIVGTLGTGRSAAMAAASLAGGVIADQVGGPAVVALGGLVGAVCAIAYTGLRAPAADGPPRFSARDSVRALRDRPVLGRITLAQGFYGGGLVAAIPLYALVYVDRLDLSLADVGIIGVLAAVSTTVCFMIWGVVVDRRGSILALRLGSVLGLASLVIYAFAPTVAFLWVAAVAGGAAGASIDVGWTAIVSEHTPLASRSAAIAGMNAITGARGIAAAFLMSALLQFGILSVTGGLMVCSISTAIGVILYARTDVTAAEVSPARPDPATVRASVATSVSVATPNRSATA